MVTVPFIWLLHNPLLPIFFLRYLKSKAIRKMNMWQTIFGMLAIPRPTLYALSSVIVTSLISFIGVLTLSLRTDKLKRMLLYLVSLSTGALFGGALLHLIPEAFREAGELHFRVSLYILTGMLGFFVLEKYIHWRHCHTPSSDEHPHHIGIMNLIGDGAHNFIDGLIIGGGYLVSIPIGLSTTIAVILHEIPQEIGDFGVLLYAGFEKKRALALNFLSALIAVLGTIVSLILGGRFGSFTFFLVPFTAGGFIYIASADLIPELKKECELLKSTAQFICIIFGISLMAALLLID